MQVLHSVLRSGPDWDIFLGRFRKLPPLKQNPRNRRYARASAVARQNQLPNSKLPSLAVSPRELRNALGAHLTNPEGSKQQRTRAWHVVTAGIA